MYYLPFLMFCTIIWYFFVALTLYLLNVFLSHLPYCSSLLQGLNRSIKRPNETENYPHLSHHSWDPFKSDLFLTSNLENAFLIFSSPSKDFHLLHTIFWNLISQSLPILQGDQKVSVHLTIMYNHQLHRDFLIIRLLTHFLVSTSSFSVS